MSDDEEKWMKQRQSDIDAIIEAEKEKDEPDEDFIRYQENLRSNYDTDDEQDVEEQDTDDDD